MLLLVLLLPLLLTARTFQHPGLTYTEGDLQRMRAMIAAKREPYYRTFQALQASHWSSPNVKVSNRGTHLKAGRMNGTIGADGRRALDLALLWRLTDDVRYAKKAVELLNANSHYVNVSSLGTGPLDCGKIFLLVEAAELLRDSPYWQPADQRRFREMLVYPGYSQTEERWVRRSGEESGDGITFYWNCFNFDSGRFGNQGLFAARGLLTMAIYLDNEVMYDRVWRYLNGMPHRPDDLPYVSGPPKVDAKPYKEDAKQREWRRHGVETIVPDYGYDEQLRYYIYANGQCQEASRDQGHVFAGLHNYVAIADIFWNQGDDLYGALDNRILLGLEWAYRHNFSTLMANETGRAVSGRADTPGPPQYGAAGVRPLPGRHGRADTPGPPQWRPTGYVDVERDATFENGRFYRARHRSGRWQSLDVSSDTGDKPGPAGTREAALAHYAIRAELSAAKMEWLQRSVNWLHEHYGHESWGAPPNWYYEWTGWGTLTRRREPGMAGTPGTWTNGVFHARLPIVPCRIAAVDFDSRFPRLDGEGHVYHDARVSTDGVVSHRLDSTLKVIAEHGLQLDEGDWVRYTIATREAGKYVCKLTLKAPNGGRLSLRVEGMKSSLTAKDDDSLSVALPRSSSLTTIDAGTLELPAGACTLRLTVIRGTELDLSTLDFQKGAEFDYGYCHSIDGVYSDDDGACSVRR